LRIEKLNIYFIFSLELSYYTVPSRTKINIIVGPFNFQKTSAWINH